MLHGMGVKMGMREKYSQFAVQQQECGILSVYKVVAYTLSKHPFIAAITIEEVNMQSLSPHTITHVSDDGEEQEIHVTIYFTGQQTHDLGEGVEYIDEAGEVYIELEDDERRLPISGDNTLALVGNAIMIAESYIRGICLREGGSVYRNLAGDCEGAGHMFR
jgi:hypothetical protein